MFYNFNCMNKFLVVHVIKSDKDLKGFWMISAVTNLELIAAPG